MIYGVENLSLKLGLWLGLMFCCCGSICTIGSKNAETKVVLLLVADQGA